MKKMRKLLVRYREIIIYLVTGGATTLVNWVVYGIAVVVMKVPAETLTILLANILAWIVAVLFAYVTNKIFVFQSYSWKPGFVLKELTLFVSVRIVTGLVEVFGVPLLVKLGMEQTLLGVEGMAAKITVSVLVVVLNYIFSKLIIFRNK